MTSHSPRAPLTAPFPAAGVVFDLDGTLVDAFGDLAAAVNRTRVHYGMAPLEVAAVRRAVGRGTRNLVRQTVPVPETEQPAAHAHFLAAYNDHLTESTRPYPGAAEVLAALADRPLGLVTNKPEAETHRLLEHLRWSHHFRVVLGGDSLPLIKPHPEPLRAYLRLTGLAPGRVVYVGDSPVDLQAAHAAGVTAIAAAYGNTPRQALAAERPAALIDRLGDLLPLLA